MADTSIEIKPRKPVVPPAPPPITPPDLPADAAYDNPDANLQPTTYYQPENPATSLTKVLGDITKYTDEASAHETTKNTLTTDEDKLRAAYKTVLRNNIVGMTTGQIDPFTQALTGNPSDKALAAEAERLKVAILNIQNQKSIVIGLANDASQRVAVLHHIVNPAILDKYDNFDDFALATVKNSKGEDLPLVPDIIKANPDTMTYLREMFATTKRGIAGARSGQYSSVLPLNAEKSGNGAIMTASQLVTDFSVSPKNFVQKYDPLPILTELTRTPEAQDNADILAVVEGASRQAKVVKLIQDRLTRFEAPSLSEGELIDALWTQPALATSEVFDAYNHWFLDPFAGQTQTIRALTAKAIGDDAYQAVSTYEKYTRTFSSMGISVLLDAISGPETPERIDELVSIGHDIDDRLTAGETWWDVSRSMMDSDSEALWGNKAAQWVPKLIMLSILDPATYIGLKATSSALSTLGKGGRYLAGLNTGWITFTDNAMVGMMDFASAVVPMTMRQASGELGKISANWFAKSLSMTYKKGFREWTVLEAKTLGNKLVDTALKFPGLAISSEMISFGKSLLIRPHITEKELGKLSKALLEIGLESGDINAFKAIAINGFYDGLQAIKNGKGATARTVAKQFLDILGTTPTEEAITMTAKWIQLRYARDIGRVRAIFEEKTINDMMKRIRMHVTDTATNNAISDLAKQSNLLQKVGYWYNKIDAIGMTAVANAINREVTLPLARQALWFFMFGPGNAVEAALRSATSGFGVLGDMYLRGNDPVKIMQLVGEYVSNVPYQYTVSGRASSLVQLTEATTKGVKEGGWLDRFAGGVYGWGKDIPSLPKQISSIKAWRTHSSDIVTSNAEASQLFQNWLENQDKIDPIGAATRVKIRADIYKQGFKSFNQRELKEKSDVLVALHAIGSDALARASNMSMSSMRAVKISSSMRKMLIEHTGLGTDMADWLTHQATSGKGLEDIDGMMSVLAQRSNLAAVSDHLNTGGLFKYTVDQMKIEHIINSAESHAFAMHTLDTLMNSHIKNLDFLTSHGADTLHKMSAGTSYREEAFKYISTEFARYNEAAETAMLDYIEHISSTPLSGFMGAKSVSKSNAALDSFKAFLTKSAAARVAEAKILSKYPINAKGVRDWDGVLAQQKAIWSSTMDAGAALKAGLLKMTDKPGTVLPKVERSLLVSHVSELLRTTPENMLVNLVNADNKIMMSKEAFVKDVWERAYSLAGDSEYKAGQAGYTRKAIAQVFDDMMFTLNLDPKNVTVMSAKNAELNSIRQSMDAIRIASAVDPEDVVKWNGFVEEIIGNTQSLPGNYIAPATFSIVGGKTALFSDILPHINNVEGNFIDPFFGSGAMSLGMADVGKVGGRIKGYEIDPKLHSVYSTMKSSGDDVEAKVRSIYNASGGRLSNSDIKAALDSFNSGTLNPVDNAANFLIWSRYAKNGNLSHTLSGKFSPGLDLIEGAQHPGRGLNRLYSDKLRATISNMKKIDIDLVNKDYYLTAIKNAKKGDVLYLDPPYDTRNLGTAYVGDWSVKDTEKMLNEAKLAQDRGVRVVISNSNNPAERSLMESKGFNIKEISIKRGPNAGKTELLATGSAESTAAYPASTQSYNKPLTSTQKFLGDTRPELDSIPEQAMEQSRKTFYATYPNYDKSNAGDALMRQLYPYWTYEINRPAWLIKTGFQKPGIPSIYNRYLEGTDDGLFDIPGTDLQVNLTANSVFSIIRRMYMKDSPEYYKNAGPLQRGIEKLSRYGFFPGAWYPIVQGVMDVAGVIKYKNDMGSVLPPPVSGALDVASAIAPDNPLVKWLNSAMFPDSWKRANIGLHLAKNGYDAEAILNKVGSGGLGIDKTAATTLTEDEQRAWDEATRFASLFKFFNTQGGNAVKYNPADKREGEYWEQLAIESWLGVPIDVQNDIKLRENITGKNIWDYVDRPDPLVMSMIYAANTANRYVGVYGPALPEEQQGKQIAISRARMEAHEIRTSYKSGPGGHDELESQVMNWARSTTGTWKQGDPPIVPPWQFGDRLSSIHGKAANAVAEMYKRYPGVPVTMAGRKADYAERGINNFTDYMGDLVDYWYEIKLEDTNEDGSKFLDENGVPGLNYDLYFSKQNMILAALTPDDKALFMAIIQANMSDIEKMYKSDNDNYLKPYNAVYEAVLATRSPEEQQIITSAYTANAEARVALKAKLDDNGKKVISDFDSDLGNVRTNMRLNNPQLDARLMFWKNLVVAKVTPGKSTALTPSQVTAWEKINKGKKYVAPQQGNVSDGSAATAIYNQIRADVATGNFRPYIQTY
jgi:DNA adenine methylase